MQIEPIELQDFTVYWDDTNLVTHQFTVAPPAQQIDLGSGTSLGISIPTTGQTIPLDVIYAMTTTGIAPSTSRRSCMPCSAWSRRRRRRRSSSATSTTASAPGRTWSRSRAVGPQGEFFSALYLFMRSWAYQYNADIPMTFMPELWPGMLVQVPAYDFQAYVTTVTHSWQMGQNGDFNTSVNIAAPARLPGADGNNSGGQLIGMPLAGGLTAGTNLPIPGQTNG